MKAFEQLERLQRMNQLIAERCTGTPAQFARKLGISERRLFSAIEEIKDLGIEICYSRTAATFYFKEGSGFEINYSLKVISQSQIKNIFGGCKKNHSLLFLCSEAIYFYR